MNFGPDSVHPATDKFSLELSALESKLIDPEAVQHEQALSFARTQILAHGLEVGNRPVIVCQNFVVDGAAMQPLSDPLGDVYLGFLGIGASARGDVVLTLRTLPGLQEAYHRFGLLDPSSRVFEIDPVLDPVVTGYPHTSPLELLANSAEAREHFSQIFAGKEKPIFVGTFLTERMRSIVSELGCDFIQTADPSVTNNKHLFGSRSQEFGFVVMPQVRIESEGSFVSATELSLAGLQSRIRRGDAVGETVTVAWLKLAGGSGGDFVQKIEIGFDDALSSDPRAAIEASIRTAFDRLRQSAREAFVHNRYGDEALAAFWPADSFAPIGSSVIVEQDARVRGVVRVNASNLMVIHEDGSWEVEGFFKQITGRDGDYRGSMPFRPEDEFSPELMKELEANMAAVAAYAHAHNVRGFIGIDFFVTESAPGQFHAVMTEMNGRIPISGAAKIMADKLNAPAWINVNLDLPEQVHTFADFERQLGEYAAFSPGDFSSCKVIPQAFRTLHDGEQLAPSSRLKALIVGPTQQACLEFLTVLNESGLGK